MMLINDLLNIYTSASRTNNPIESDDYLSIFNGKDYINIPLEGLSITEIIMLNKLNVLSINNSEWYTYLVQNGERPISDNVRFVHFQVESLNDKGLYLDMIRNLFDDIVDAFFITTDRGVIITKDASIQTDTIEAQINALDEDFGTRTRLFIGIPLPSDLNLKRNFEEEQQLFNTTSSKISSYADTFIIASFKETFEKSTIAKHIYDSISRIEDGEKIVRSLWENQANLSQCANHLFIHRNTLNYRLDKFYELTELNLRILDDLSLCYWIVNTL